MPNTGTSVHHVIFDARRQRYEGAVTIANAAERRVSVPGHPSWDYRRIARAMVAASQLRTTARDGGRHDHS